MRRLVLLLCAVVVVVSLLATARVGWCAYGPAPSSSVREAQVRHLRAAVAGGAAERMQGLFPEGYVFTHALVGLASATPAPPGDAVALADARRALDAVGSPRGTAPFAAAQQPRFGAFHTGWSLLLAVEVARLSGRLDDAALARSLATEVMRALAASPSGLLTSYPGQVWPVDTVVAVAGVARASRLLAVPGGAEAVQRWVRRIQPLLDAPTGLLPHRVSVSGEVLDGPRGSSQALIQLFWPDVDPASAAASWASFCDEFVVRRAGLVGVREYPDGRGGFGDVDSGPLLLGVSASASAVALGAARRAGDVRLATNLSREAELFGAPLQWRGRRSYALGLVPVGDAFLAYARAQPVQGGAATAHPSPRWPALMLLTASPALLALLVARRRRRSARRLSSTSRRYEAVSRV